MAVFTLMDMAEVMGPGQLDWQHGREAELPWPTVLPDGWIGAAGWAEWALGEMARAGIEVPDHLRRAAAQVIAYVYEAGYGAG